MRRSLSILLFLLLAAGVVSAQPTAHFTPEDQALFNDYLSYIEPYRERPVDILLEKTATFFLGKPYGAHTLEVTDEEMLVVNLREFDCTTFVETVIALTLTVSKEASTFSHYCNELQKIRYRPGKPSGYSSRLHYTTDWIYHNEQKGVVEQMTASLGGVIEDKQIGFISSHREAYRQLKGDDKLLQEMITMERAMNRREGFYYLPKEMIGSSAGQIPHMAMIAFTTDIKGLDVSHMGFSFREGGGLTFIHASSAKNRVVIDEKSLSDYCASQPSCTGIMVVRLLE